MKPKYLNFEFDNKYKSLEVQTKQDLLAKVLEGRWVSRFKGRGMEFSEFRSYVYGDDASAIDWKASLKSNSTLVRVFEEEKNPKVVFIFDVSDSMLFSSRHDGKMKVEFAAELIVKMANSILKTGVAVGLAMFSDTVVAKVKPNIGVAMEHEIKELLRNVDNYGGNFDFSKAMKYVLSFSSLERYVFILVSDFIGLEKNWEKYIEILNQKFDLIGLMIRDHRDRYLPTTGGQIVLQHSSSNEKLYVDAKQYSELYHEKVLKTESDIEKMFKAAKADLLKIETTEDGFSKVVNFLETSKQRRDR
jgi:uncharacterized protein (DUF58 family)